MMMLQIDLELIRFM